MYLNKNSNGHAQIITGKCALVRAWRFANIAVSRECSTLACDNISKKYNVSPLSTLGHCLCPWARHFTIT